MNHNVLQVFLDIVATEFLVPAQRLQISALRVSASLNTEGMNVKFMGYGVGI